MSVSYEDPHGEEPTPDVYRRRRLIALAALLLVVLLIIWGITSLIGAMNKDKSPDENAAAPASSSAQPFSDFTDRATESSSASASASATDTASASDSASATASESATSDPTDSATPSESASASTSAEPTETAAATPTTPAAPVACTANDMKVELTADQASYAAGQNPALAVTYTNVSNNPCTVGGNSPQVDVNITSGSAQVYNLAQCTPEKSPSTEVAAGASDTKVVTWNRSLNALGCGTTQTIKPGYYWATATVNGIASQPTRIVVKG